MKTTKIIIAAVLALQLNVLFAGNEIVSSTSTASESSISIELLAPALPKEATFEPPAVVLYNDLAPVAPAEATFEELSTGVHLLSDLFPATPETADFNDGIEVTTTDVKALAPVTPAEADFE